MLGLRVSLTEDLTDYAETRARENPSQYVAGLIEADKQKQAVQARIDALLSQGLQSIEEGKGIEVTPEYWTNKKARLSQKLKS